MESDFPFHRAQGMGRQMSSHLTFATLRLRLHLATATATSRFRAEQALRRVEPLGTDQNPVIHLYTCERLRPEARGARGLVVR